MLTEFAEARGISHQAMSERIRRGVPLDRADAHYWQIRSTDGYDRYRVTTVLELERTPTMAVVCSA